MCSLRRSPSKEYRLIFFRISHYSFQNSNPLSPLWLPDKSGLVYIYLGVLFLRSTWTMSSIDSRSSTPTDPPHRHTGTDGLSNIIACIRIRQYIVEDNGKWINASILNVPNSDGPINGLFSCSTMRTRTPQEEITRDGIFLICGSVSFTPSFRPQYIEQPWHSYTAQ